MVDFNRSMMIDKTGWVESEFDLLMVIKELPKNDYCDCPCCRAMRALERAEDDGVMYDIDQLTESPPDYDDEDDEDIDDDFDDDYEEDEPPYDYSDPWDELDDDEDDDDDLTGEL